MVEEESVCYRYFICLIFSVFVDLSYLFIFFVCLCLFSFFLRGGGKKGVIIVS